MTARKHRKRLVRQRAARTGESYTAALRHLRNRTMEEATMSDTNDVLAEKLFSCSFCTKSQKQVKKLIAGPGVYICDECVGLCDTILEQELTEPKAAVGNRSVDELLADLPALAHTASLVEEDLARRVRRLRELGVDWPAIGAALGVDASDARSRFAP